MNKETEWQVRKSLTTPILVMGTEKTLLILNVTMCAGFILATRFSWLAFLGIVLFLTLHTICLVVSKHDPRAVAIFKRSTRYTSFYPASPGIERRYSRKFSAFPLDVMGRQ